MLPTSNNDNDPPTWPDICVPSVIYWRKPETLTIRVRRSWRTERHIDSCDFLHAGLRAKCCHPTTLQEMKCFKCSKDGSPVKLVVQNHLAEYDPPRDLEQYLFTIKTTCTSSRNHLHSTVVIVIDLPKHNCVLAGSAAYCSVMDTVVWSFEMLVPWLWLSCSVEMKWFCIGMGIMKLCGFAPTFESGELVVSETLGGDQCWPEPVFHSNK
ncbi:hypothetical protein Pelo_8588 [Pelomyxa schiedti]|nr:hypothetical protein Pelo_8588 [Pelomyxa schiedti]